MSTRRRKRRRVQWIRTASRAPLRPANLRPSKTPKARVVRSQLNRLRSRIALPRARARLAELTNEQRTKITSVIKERKVERVNLNVSVSVGTRIPAGVRLHPLPQQVIIIYPEWRGYDYILVGDQ